MIVPKRSEYKPSGKVRYKDKDWEEFKDFFFRLGGNSPVTHFDLIIYPFRAFLGLLIWGH